MSDAPQTGAAMTAAATAAEIKTNVAAVLGRADATAAQRLQTLSQVHKARLAQLTRTAAGVTARYGAGSAQATVAEAAVTAAKATVARVAVVSRQVGTTAPSVAAGGWALYGHLYNAELQPVAAYCVFLVDAQNAYQSAYGFTYTDSTGYFLISFAGTPAGSQGPTQQQTQAAAAAPTPPPPPSPAPPSQLFIEIANANGQPVFLSKTALQPQLGSATYQNITLPAGEKPIGDPPAAIRPIALPPAQKGS
jgi:hypothetical protein